MVPASGNSLSLQAISRVLAVFLTLLGGQIPGEGDNMRIRLRLVALTVFPRLQSVPRLPVRQSNILLEPTTPASRTSFVSNGVAAQQIVRPSSPHLVILPEGRTSYGPGNLHPNALAGIFIVEIFNRDYSDRLKQPIPISETLGLLACNPWWHTRRPAWVDHVSHRSFGFEQNPEGKGWQATQQILDLGSCRHRWGSA